MTGGHNPRFSQDGTPDDAPKHSPANPADANVRREWIGVFGKVGLTVVAVRAAYSDALWQNPGFEEVLGGELSEANLGQYDSAKYGNPIIYFF